MSNYDLAKIDALVAERVTQVKPRLSWEVSNDGGHSSAFSSYAGPGRFDRDVHKWLADMQAQGMMIGYTIVQWKHYEPYSERIAAAWKVVENLHARPADTTQPKWTVNVRLSGDKCIVDITDWKEWVDVSVCDKSPPLAICLAALRAVGVSEEEIEACRE